MASLISVTSSGRSSIKRISKCISGLFLSTACATCLSKVVLPAFGGDTIIPRCPFPIGESKSTILMATLVLPFSKRSLSSGKIGVISSKFFLYASSEGCTPFTFVTYKSALNFSCCDLILIFPVTISPVFNPNLRI